jgi:hypothetical protein
MPADERLHIRAFLGEFLEIPLFLPTRVYASTPSDTFIARTLTGGGPPAQICPRIVSRCKLTEFRLARIAIAVVSSAEAAVWVDIEEMVAWR